MSNYQTLINLVDQNNLTYRDIAYIAFVSKDTAKAYLSPPNSKRHRLIPDKALKLLIDAIEEREGDLKRLYSILETAPQRLTKILKTDLKSSTYEVKKEFQEVLDELEDIGVLIACIWGDPYMKDCTIKDHQSMKFKMIGKKYINEIKT